MKEGRKRKLFMIFKLVSVKCYYYRIVVLNDNFSYVEEFDEISFKIGDIIEKIEEVDDDWCIGEINGKRGMFPITFVKII